jgi:hypothetical protein
VAADVADVNLIAELVSKERCLPVDEWVTDVTPVANVITFWSLIHYLTLASFLLWVSLCTGVVMNLV